MRLRLHRPRPRRRKRPFRRLHRNRQCPATGARGPAARSRVPANPTKRPSPNTPHLPAKVGLRPRTKTDRHRRRKRKRGRRMTKGTRLSRTTKIGLRTRQTNRSPPRLSLSLLHLSGPTTLPHQHRALFRRLRAIPALRRPAPTLTFLSRPALPRPHPSRTPMRERRVTAHRTQMVPMLRILPMPQTMVETMTGPTVTTSAGGCSATEPHSRSGPTAPMPHLGGSQPGLPHRFRWACAMASARLRTPSLR